MLISKNHITYHVNVSFTNDLLHPIKAKISTEGKEIAENSFLEECSIGDLKDWATKIINLIN
jgi:hypothetical protein